MISKTITLFRSLNLQYTYISFFSFFTFQFKSFRIFFLPGYISKDAISIDCTYLLFFLDTVYYYCNRPIVKVFNLIKLRTKNCFRQTLLTNYKPCEKSNLLFLDEILHISNNSVRSTLDIFYNKQEKNDKIFTFPTQS